MAKATKPLSDALTCMWPIGDPSKADFRFCGARREPGQSYCAEHRERAYQKATKRDRTPIRWSALRPTTRNG